MASFDIKDKEGQYATTDLPDTLTLLGSLEVTSTLEAAFRQLKSLFNHRAFLVVYFFALLLLFLFGMGLLALHPMLKKHPYLATLAKVWMIVTLLLLVTIVIMGASIVIMTEG